MAFRHYLPTEIVFGVGCLDELRERCRPLGQKALVVTGTRSARATGILDRVLAQLPGAAVFDEVEQNPGTATCDRAAARCREAGCDVVVAVGGGSPMDVAKAAAGLALNDGPCSAHFGADTFKLGSLPVVAVPTTAGTGSEVTPGAVIVDTDNGIKRTIKGSALFPRLALLDPELTLPLPRDITVNTGLDVLSQAAEGYVSKKAALMTDVLALEAVRLVKSHLPRAAAHGDDLGARAGMLYASLLSGCVIAQTGTTLVHGMGYYFTLECGVAHGLANALLLTPLFQHNAQYEPEKVAAVAAALGCPSPPMPRDASGAIARAFHGLLAELDVSPAARDAGVDAERLRGFAEHIVGDPYRFRNQVGDVGLGDVLGFFEQAYEGRIR
ncbi:MAG: iron-containing alcohol dehydrogenase [Candidatus Hydrogenedentes bacterium]|nr:iron-containing alcohol dehydrogenase [Candidatus Hydrogenedentota bacterium]